MTLERSTGVVNVSGVGHAGGVPVAAQFEPSNCQLTLRAVGGAVVAPPEPVGVAVVDVAEGAVGLDDPFPPQPASAPTTSRTTTAAIRGAFMPALPTRPRLGLPGGH